MIFNRIEKDPIVLNISSLPCRNDINIRGIPLFSLRKILKKTENFTDFNVNSKNLIKKKNSHQVSTIELPTRGPQALPNPDATSSIADHRRTSKGRHLSRDPS